jgi:hypothetical protein
VLRLSPCYRGVQPAPYIISAVGSFSLFSRLATENPLLGAWKLKSIVRELLPTGEKHSLLGEHPTGYTGYSPDERRYAIITADKRLTPHDVAPSDEERVMLHRTMVAYAGAYSVEGEKVTHQVDISWNQAWNGTDLIRFTSWKEIPSRLTQHPLRARSMVERGNRSSSGRRSKCRRSKRRDCLRLNCDCR